MTSALPEFDAAYCPRHTRIRMRIGRFGWPDTASEYIADTIAHAIWIAFAGYVLWVFLNKPMPSIHEVVYASLLLAVAIASTFNNMTPVGHVRLWLSKIDRAIIYPFIAATCGAFLTLGGLTDFKTVILVIVWAAAIVGIIMKLGFPNRFHRFGIALYAGLGWFAMIGILDILPHLGWLGAALLVAGGLVYTLGIPVYLNDDLPYRAAIWHCMCLLAGLFHFTALQNSALA